MNRQKAPFFLFPLLILPPVTTLLSLCQAQNILKTPESSQGSDNIASAIRHRYQRLSNHDPISKELSEDFSNTETITLLGNDVDMDASIVGSKKEFEVIPYSEKFKKSGSDSMMGLIPKENKESSHAPNEVNAEFKANSGESPVKLENVHEPSRKALPEKPYNTLVNTNERQNNKLSNLQNNFHYLKTIKFKGESPERATETILMNQNNSIGFGIKSPTSKSLLANLHNNDYNDYTVLYNTFENTKERQSNNLSNLQNNGENFHYLKTITSRRESPERAIETTLMNQNSSIGFGIKSPTNKSLLSNLHHDDYNNFSQKMHQMTELPKSIRQTSDSMDNEPEVKNEKINFTTIRRDIKSSKENFEVSSKKSPPVMTDVKELVKEDARGRKKNNKTLNLVEKSKDEECEKGSESCLECREISPYCHYNFRSKLCFYADNAHGNEIYECGIRFFTADGYLPFWIALGLILAGSLVVLFFLARAFYRHNLQKNPITDMEVDDVRNIVHLIREKRNM